MKKTVFFLLILLLISVSVISQTTGHGQYDEAIKSLVVKLKKRPEKTSAIKQLDSLYQLANNQDSDHIRKLKLSGQSDIWNEVYNTYQNLISRQESVDELTTEVKEQMGFSSEDYKAFLNESLIKTCDYYYCYALAQKDPKSRNTEAPPKALHYLQEIDTIKPDYKDVQKLLAIYQKAEPLAVYYRVENKYHNELPSSMANAI